MKRDFKDIPEFEGYYEINSDGVIRTKERWVLNRGTKVLKKPIIKKPHDNNRGYHQVNLHKLNKVYKLYVHRLVFITHVSDIPEGYEIDHKNANRKDNRVKNLEAVSKQENLRRMLRNSPHVLNNLKKRNTKRN